MKELSATPISTVIFDFDGTLADSLDAFIAVGKELLQIDKTPTKRDIQRLRGMKPLDIMKEFDIKPWRIPKLLLEGRKTMASKADIVTVFSGVEEMLHELKAAGYNIYVLSTNAQPIINKVLRRNELNKLLNGIYAGASVTGKASMIRKLLKVKGLGPNECVYVGDELRDIEAARKAKVHIISVSWGYNSAELLKTLAPDAIVNKPSEMTSTVSKLSQ